MLINGNILDYGGVFLGGLVVSLTPCVYPLIPVTTAAIAGANVNGTRRGAFLLSLLYVLGMAISYAGLAVFAASTGKIFGVVQNTPVFLGAIGCVFLFCGLAMLDVLSFPAMRFLASVKAKSPWTVFLLGITSGLAVGPCTAPALGAVLVYVASKHNILYGASLLFVFAFGAGTTLIIAGTFGGVISSWPRSGAWMVWIKRGAGLVLLGFAGYYFLRTFGVV